MAASGSTFKNKAYALVKSFAKGLYGYREANRDLLGDILQIDIATGTAALPDIPAVAGTYPLILPGEIPGQYDLTNLGLMVNGGVAWTGGTGGNVSLSLVGTDGTVICTFTGNVLTGNFGVGLAVGAMPPAGVVDNLIKTIGPTFVGAGVGLNAVVAANSTTGSPVRIRLTGRAVG